MSYIGVPPFGQTVRTITESLATAGQSTFNISGGYLPGYIDVFLNGSALGAADFTATNGSTVVLNVAAALNDEFKAIAYWPVSLIDTYRKAEADALLAARVGTTSSVSMRNRIINGDMRIDQRNAGASVTPTYLQYGVDRWQYPVSQNSKFTAQQSSVAPAGFTNSMLITSASAYAVLSTDYFGVQQKIEGFNTYDLGWGSAGAQSITLSFWVRSSLTGIFGGVIGNSNGSRNYPFTYTISFANTWEQKTVVIPGDTTGTWNTGNGAGIVVEFGLGAGSSWSGTAGSWTGTQAFSATGATSVVGTNGATFYITGVQLEAGTVATPFERRDYGRELMMCQRYYENSFNGVAAVNGTSGSIQSGMWSPYSPDDARSSVIPFKTAKRATATLTFYNDTSTTATSGMWARYNGTWNDVVPSAGTTNIWGFYVQGYRAGGFTSFYTYLGSGFWAASAEL